MTLTYFAEITPKPEHFTEARAAVASILDQTRAEEGCLEFRFFSDPGETRLFLMETWRDMAAFELHHAQAYTRAVFAAYENWLAKPPVLTEIVAAA